MQKDNIGERGPGGGAGRGPGGNGGWSPSLQALASPGISFWMIGLDCAEWGLQRGFRGPEV